MKQVMKQTALEILHPIKKSGLLKVMFVGTFCKSNLSVMLELVGGFEIVSKTVIGETAINLYPVVRPDVILIDIFLPGMSGFETGRFIKEQHPPVKIILLSEKFNIEFLRASMALDMDGYLPKNISLGCFEHAIRSIKSDKSCFDTVIAGPC
jgi:DNA-binding NarL/FixJ family response regulator